MRGVLEGSATGLGAPLRPLGCAAALCLLVTAPAAGQGPVRVGVVDLDAVISQTSGGASLREHLADLRREADAEEARLRGEIETLRSSLAVPGQASDERRELEQRIDRKRLDLSRHQEDTEKQARRLEEAAFEKVKEEMAPVFERLASEHGFDLILDRATGLVLIVGEVADVTDLALEILRERRPPPSVEGDVDPPPNAEGVR